MIWALRNPPSAVMTTRAPEVVNAIGQGLVGEAAENRGVDDPKPLGRLGVIQLLGDVGHVEGDAVTPLQSQVSENDTGARDFEEQPPTADDLLHDRSAAAAVDGLIPPVALEYEGRLRAPARKHVAIDLIEAGVRQAAIEPAEEGRVVVYERA